MQRYHRKVITITALDSPNVQRGLKQERQGITPDNKRVVPGVLSYAMFKRRKRLWDPIRKSVGLYARFWKGASIYLFPGSWMDRAHDRAFEIEDWGDKRWAKAIGVDPAEGGNSTSMCAVDEFGILPPDMSGLVSEKTPNTARIRGELLAFARYHGVPDEGIFMDAGGGGKQIADDMAEEGHDINLVEFGSAVSRELSVGTVDLDEREDAREERYAYVNIRAKMYYQARLLLDPSRDVNNGHGFAIPREYERLRHELSKMPLLYDKEGRIRMLPKNRVGNAASSGGKREKTLTELIGYSPDEADSFVLAVHGMMNPLEVFEATAF